MGTAFHAPTRRSLQWFVDDAARRACRSTRGWCSSAVMSTRLFHADAHPRAGGTRQGFGLRADGLPGADGIGAGAAAHGVRGPDAHSGASCAGVPSLVSAHASQALDLPPGVQVLKDSAWCSLTEAMRQSMDVAFNN